MATSLILIAAVPLLAGLLCCEKRNSTRGLLATKPLLSALFVAAALTGTGTGTPYFRWILAGLLLCMAGDVFLIFFFARKPFLAGLVSFLAGHVLYAVAFFTLAGGGGGNWIVTAVFAAASGCVFVWLRPHLGRMLVPVALYVIVITAMAIGAAALAANEAVPFEGRALAFAGALLFYLSDLFVARQRFVKANFLNRAIGLPLYYAGQFMIAFSIRLV
jgi:uncharacterized membrane protein YhhN